MKNSENRIEKLLAVILINTIKKPSTAEKAIQLNIAGFSNIEIADFLETSPQVVANALSAARKDKKTRKKIE